MFKIRRSEEIVQYMIDYTRGQTTEITDFSVGSKTRTIYEAIGNIAEELYYRLWQGAKSLIEEQIYKIFDFSLLPASKAEGVAKFSRTDPAVSNITIPIGTNITTSVQESITPVVYETTATVILAAGSTYVTAPIRATREGSYANVPANKLTVFQTSVPGVDFVTNEESIANGTDEESKESRKLRFRKFIVTRSQGTNEALKYGAEQVAGVIQATVRENPELTLFSYDDASMVFTDNSFETNNPYGSSFNPMPSTPVLNDCCYIGAAQKFDFLYFRMPSTYTPGTGVWEYWNGSAWASIPSAVDGTNGLTNSGLLYFPIPADWRDSKISSTWLFWVRYRATNSWGDNPEIYHIFASPPPGYVDVYIQDANAEASTSLIAQAATAIERYRGSGITVNVRAPSKTILTVNASIKISGVYDSTFVLEKVKTTIINHVNAFVLGQNFVVTRLETEILNLDDGGGQMVDSVDITLPSVDTLANPGEIFRTDTDHVEVSVVN